MFYDFYCLQIDPGQDRKRTRGVQSSIASAMALKEKRATLMEAKEIRKAKQMQIENEINEHQQQQQNQHAYIYSTKNENTSLPLNTMSPEEPPSKFIRLGNVEKVEYLNTIGSRRSSVDSSYHGSSMLEPVHDFKREYVDNSDDQESITSKKGKHSNSWFHKNGLMLGSPSTQPPTSLFNEEDHENLLDDGATIKTEKIKSEKRDWSELDILLNRHNESVEENKCTLDIIGDKEDNASREFSSVDDEELDLVSECMTQSENHFPNVDELVSGLAPFTSTANISQSMGSSKTCIYPNILIGSPSPVSSQTCSSIAS